jgi:hypothetical protein
MVRIKGGRVRGAAKSASGGPDARARPVSGRKERGRETGQPGKMGRKEKRPAGESLGRERGRAEREEGLGEGFSLFLTFFKTFSNFKNSQTPFNFQTNF